MNTPKGNQLASMYIIVTLAQSQTKHRSWKVIGLFGSRTKTSCDQRTKSRCIPWFYNPNVDVQIHVLTHQITRLLSYSTYQSVPDICIDLVPFSWSLLPVERKCMKHAHSIKETSRSKIWWHCSTIVIHCNDNDVITALSRRYPHYLLYSEHIIVSSAAQ